VVQTGGHNKRSCRTANDSRISAQGEDSDTEAEVEAKADAIVVEIPTRKYEDGVVLENAQGENR
jgi:hypothetical protein